MDTFLDVAYSVYLSKLDEMYEKQFEYENEYEGYDDEELEYLMEEETLETPSVYFEDIEDELYFELDYTLNEVKNISLESKIEEKISKLPIKQQELMNESIEDFIKNVNEKEINEEMAEIFVINNMEKIKETNKSDIEILNNTKECALTIINDMKENIKEETLDDKLEKVNEKINKEKVGEDIKDYER